MKGGKMKTILTAKEERILGCLSKQPIKDVAAEFGMNKADFKKAALEALGKCQRISREHLQLGIDVAEKFHHRQIGITDEEVRSVAAAAFKKLK